jgi:hypothetical protein
MITPALAYYATRTAARWIPLALAGAALAATGIAWQAERAAHAHTRAQHAAQAERQARDTLRQIERGQQAADTYTKEQTHARPAQKTITRTVERIVTRPVYRNVCLDDDGLQQLRAAIATGAPPSDPAAALPTAEPAE